MLHKFNKCGSRRVQAIIFQRNPDFLAVVAWKLYRVTHLIMRLYAIDRNGCANDNDLKRSSSLLNQLSSEKSFKVRSLCVCLLLMRRMIDLGSDFLALTATRRFFGFWFSNQDFRVVQWRTFFKINVAPKLPLPWKERTNERMNGLQWYFLLW